MSRPSNARSVPPALREADAMLRRIADVARLLPALTAENGAAERKRAVAQLEAGEVPSPAWTLKRRRVDPVLLRACDAIRARVAGTLVEELYAARVDELELELAMIDALGEPKRIRPIAARRFGTGRDRIDLPDGPLVLATAARALLADLPHKDEARVIPPYAPDGGPSLAALMHEMARVAGLSIEVRVEPRLSAGAATGERTVFLADRKFGRRESLRFAVHEILGHAVAAANARSQPIRIWEIGTAGSFSAQEGLALYLEEQAGVLDSYRLRVIAARVLTADRMRDGAPFGETARWLHRDEGFCAPDAIGIVERAYRGGGLARDVGYLSGWLRVRSAIEQGLTTVDHLRAGRLGIAAAVRLPELIEAGLAREPRYAPSLPASLLATESGTRRETSPPSFAASFTMLEET